ncbi:VOC family protein [Chitinophaga solisilvae]|uniref:VOC family protein n=1 Tax=Chitinophaga solisilvae TaxID=1233460 RepID=UPI001F324F17|nr:VOC family protein [Chitinophaga solisilvae]
MIQKISKTSNVITWFEIPVTDTARAKKFYETILDIEMRTQHFEETNEELTFFPAEPGVIQATSGRVSGALVKNDRQHPAADGIRVYLNAYPRLQTVIDKIEPAGGKLLQPRTQIPAGYIAVFSDTEGNTVAIHAEE